ncbi:MAG TPA: right-handed parallel beta-helix repeat-containing protein [Solirubrobacterales bacterium]|nr:right-handed parallel beta-helix repeat-containing protein [Solirubrobacterales bacterium]
MIRNRAGMSIGLIAAAAAIAIVAAGAAIAHVERSTFWPNPAPDKSVKPAAGGEVPDYRSLGSALKRKPPGDTRIVCQDDSLKLAKQAIRKGRKGFTVRPSEDKRRLKKRKARKLKKLNKKFANKCDYDSIQDAVNDSGNNDRIVIMPGFYTEPESLAKPEDDPACADLLEDSDHGSGAVSYRYQAECPNDQNLIAIIGREAADVGTPAVNPNTDRHGIPNAGRCIRCNLQIEGSGVRPEDVTIDAGNGPSANGPLAGEGKDVGIRAERADGFYLRNVTLQHAEEHGVYPVETDGYAIDRVKMAYNHEYGHLAFTSDHGLIKNCDALGSGDAGVYPGASAQTGEQTVEKKQRYNHTIKKCDLHHNTLGHSGSMGDGIHILKSDVYDNALGIAVDSISAAGHPGYPQDSILVEKNRIYSNNLNPYKDEVGFAPTFPYAAVGTGLVIFGGNANLVKKNHFFDNWRYGALLVQIPDFFACDLDQPQQTCSPDQFPEQSNSHRNRFFKNQMGRVPGRGVPGPKGLVGGSAAPNGTDFRWGNQEGDKNNCWYKNKGVDKTRSSVTEEPDPLPSDCDTSAGTGPIPQDVADCVLELPTCEAVNTPPRPGTANRSRGE